MAGSTHDWPIRNRTARQEMLAREKQAGRKVQFGNGYPRPLNDRLALIYVPSAVAGRAGSWRVRRRPVGGGSYRFTTLGRADDLAGVEADAENVFTFDQAEAAARAWALADAIEEAREARRGGPTVGDAVRAYIARRKVAHPEGGDAEYGLTHHVLSAPLAEVELANLGRDALHEWSENLVAGGKVANAERARAAKANRAAVVTPLAASTKARIFNDLKAALREAGEAKRLPEGYFGEVRRGLKRPDGIGNGREPQTLETSKIQEIVAASEEEGQDFADLVYLLAVTGLRFSQVKKLRIADIDFRNDAIDASRSDKGKKNKEGVARTPLAPDVMARVKRIAGNRDGAEPLLLRDRWERATGVAWQPAGRKPWREAGEMTVQWYRTLARVGLPETYTPYALRHSSIVRQLEAGVPARAVAIAHDTSIRMMEVTYARAMSRESDNILRRAALSFAPSAPQPPEPRQHGSKGGVVLPMRKRA